MTFNPQVLRVGEVENYTVDFANRLATGEVLTGTPTVTEDPAPSPIELDASGPGIGSPATTVTFAVDASAAVSGKVYKLLLSVATNSTPPRTLDETVIVRMLP